MSLSPITSWKIDWKKMKTVTDFIFGAPKSLWMVTEAVKLKDPCFLEESYDKPRQHIKQQRHYFVNKGPSSQSYGFSSSYVWELDPKEGWVLKNWYFFLNFILFLNFTILYWFCYISKWIRHRYTCVPHSEPSSLLPPHTIPLGRPIAPAPSIQYRASNLDWRLVSYMILYMF